MLHELGADVNIRVAFAATEEKPIDAALVTDVMNLLISRTHLRDLHSLRTACQLTMRGSFPVPSYPLMELPTGVVESFVGGRCSRDVSFECLCKALALHDAEAAASGGEW
jgi:hypothetical protein